MAYGAVGTGIQTPPAQLIATMNALTQKYVLPVLGDAVFTPSPAFWMFNRNGKHIQGGELVIPIATIEETTGGAYYGDQLLNTATSDSIAPATSVWRGYYESMSIPILDAILNAGSGGALPLVETKFQVACASFLQKLSRSIWGVAPQNTSIDIDNIPAWVLSTTNTIAGIDRNAAPGSAFWKPAANVSVGGAPTIAKMEQGYQSVVFGYDEPDIFLWDYTKYYEFKNLYVGNNRQVNEWQDDEAVQAGFRYHFMFNNAVVMPDRFVPAGYAYLLNSKYLYPVYHEDDYFTVSPFIMGTNQRVVVSNMYLTWQMICTSPRMNVAYTGIT